MRKPRLHNQWKQSWKWFSVQAMGAGASLQLLWANLPEDLKSGVNPKLIPWLTGLILALGMIGRIIKQASEDES